MQVGFGTMICGTRGQFQWMWWMCIPKYWEGAEFQQTRTLWVSESFPFYWVIELLREGLQCQALPKSWRCQKGGGGSDPCQDFSGEFEQSFARILNNLLPRFWTIFCQDFGIRSLYPLSNPTSLSHLYQVNMFGCVTNNVIYLQGHSRHSLSAYQHPVALSCKPTPRKLYITMQALFKMGTMWVLYVASIYLFINI